MEELDEANTGAINQSRSGTAPVHILVDTLEITRVPVSLKAIKDLIAYTREPNLGYIIYISNNPFISFLNSTIAQFSKAKFITVKTLEEALVILPRIDTSLQELMEDRV